MDKVAFGTNSVARQVRPVSVKLLVVFEILFGFLGLMSAYTLLTEPSGIGMGLSTDLLKYAPVGDFALVGMFFLAFYFILPMIAAYGLLARPRWKWTDAINRWTGQNWAWTATVALGTIMLLWIVIELVFVGPLGGIGGALQIIISVLGIGVLIGTFRPSVREYLKA